MTATALLSLACPHCGAPARVVPGPGSFTCRYCGQGLQLERRPDGQVLVRQVAAAIRQDGDYTRERVAELAARQQAEAVFVAQTRLLGVQALLAGLGPHPKASPQRQLLLRQQRLLAARLAELGVETNPPRAADPDWLYRLAGRLVIGLVLLAGLGACLGLPALLLVQAIWGH